MANELEGKKASSTFKDLFHINNDNNGVDETLRSIYSGNGIETPIKISEDKVEINAGDGIFSNIVLQDSKNIFYDYGDVSGSWQIALNVGNYQKITKIGNITSITFLNVPEDDGNNKLYELTLFIESSGSHSINWPSGVKWPTGAPPLLSASSGNYDIIKMISMDLGSTWLSYLVAGDIS